MTLPLHLPIPAQLWLPLGLAALAPLVVLLVIAPLARRRTHGIATILTLQTVVVLSLGFAILATVATISVVHTGLRELRERHASAIRTLARELERTPVGSGGANARIALTLFRARYPSVAFVAVGSERCRTDCTVVSADDSPAAPPLAPRIATLWPNTPDGEILASVNGRSLLVVAEPLRDAASGHATTVVVGIAATALADQATSTAWILLAIGYGLMLVVGAITWRQLDRTVGARIAAITRQIRAGSGEEDVPLQIRGNELSELADAVTSYIQRTVEQQRTSDERYRRLVELVPDGILMCTRLAIKFANSAALTLSGMRSRYEVIGQPIERFLSFEPMRAHEEPGGLRPARWTRVDGSIVHVEVAELTDRATDDDMRQYMVRDMTDRRAREAALAHRAEHDSLTGLANRAAFESRLVDRLEARASTRVAERTRDIALLFIDLDGFKPVNDRHGHAAGDAVLVGVAARLRESTRATDVIARLGGDEFAVLLDVRDQDEVRAVAERILQSLTRPVRHDGADLTVGASIGIADTRLANTGLGTVPLTAAAAATELLRAADAAMYAAKANGGRRYRVTPPPGQSLAEHAPVSFRDVA